MFVVLIVRVLGALAYCLPDFLGRGICMCLGSVIWYGPFGRRRHILANLRRAYPQKDARWRGKIGRESCYRLIEMGMFVLVSPYYSQAKIKRHFKLDPSLETLLDEVETLNSPLVILVTHFSLMEAITLFPALTTRKLPPTGVIYRPLNIPALDAWVKQTRQRWGITLFSRRDGVMDAIDNVRRNGAMAVMCDQNAGRAGAASLFFGRLAFTTLMPGMVAERQKARVGALYIERTGFFRGTIKAHELKCPCTREAIAVEGNLWLESRLRQSDDITADWMWSHNRWGRRKRVHCMTPNLFRENLLPLFYGEQNVTDIPDKDRYWITLPEDAKKLDALLPVLRVFKQDYPGIHITALACDATLETARQAGIADETISRTGKPLSFFKKISNDYPNVHLVFEESARANVEARYMKAFLRVGFAAPRARLCLTDVLRIRETDDAQRYRVFGKMCGMKRLP